MLGILIGSSAVAAVLLAVSDIPDSVRELFDAPTETPAATALRSKSSLPAQVAVQDAFDPNAMMAADQPSAISTSKADSLSGNEDPLSTALSPRVSGGESAAGVGGVASAQAAHRSITVATATTAYALTQAMVQRLFPESEGLIRPQISRRSTSASLKAFCEAGEEPSPDAVIASRRMTAAEFNGCQRNGIDHIIEAKLGHQAIVITAARIDSAISLTPRDIYLAIAKQIPDPNQSARLIDNPNRSWSQVNPSLDLGKFEVLGPPQTSRIRDVFAEVVMEEGCDTYPWIKALKDAESERYTAICHTVREDGVYVDTEQTNTLVSQRLWAEPTLVAILSYEFFDRNRELLTDNLLQGAAPTADTIESGSYPAGRVLYLYFSKARYMKSAQLMRFANDWLEDLANRRNSYNQRPAFVPLQAAELKAVQSDVRQLKALKLQDLPSGASP